MNKFDYFKKDFKTYCKNAVNFFYRQGIWILLGFCTLYFLNPGSPEIRTLLLMGTFESIALWLSGIAVVSYTSIDLVKEFKAGKSIASGLVLAAIFFGVHFLVGVSVALTYWLQFAE